MPDGMDKDMFGVPLTSRTRGLVDKLDGLRADERGLRRAKKLARTLAAEVDRLNALLAAHDIQDHEWDAAEAADQADQQVTPVRTELGPGGVVMIGRGGRQLELGMRIGREVRPGVVDVTAAELHAGASRANMEALRRFAGLDDAGEAPF